jgi:ribosomal subunit interface protein
MLPIQITFRSMPDSPTVEYLVNKYYKKLKRSYNKISRCHAVVDFAHKNKRKDKIFSIRLDLSLPGKELVSKKQNENIYLAIRDGFTALEKLLKKHHKRKIVFANKRSYYGTEASFPENEALSSA